MKRRLQVLHPGSVEFLSEKKNLSIHSCRMLRLRDAVSRVVRSGYAGAAEYIRLSYFEKALAHGQVSVAGHVRARWEANELAFLFWDVDWN